MIFQIHIRTSFNNLAQLYYSQGRYNEAELMYIEALAMIKRLFVGDHPNVATSLNNLAQLYYSQGRYNEAELMYIEALGIYDRLLEVNHPLTATIRHNLTLLQRQLTPRLTWKRRLCQFVQNLYNLLNRRS